MSKKIVTIKKRSVYRLASGELRVVWFEKLPHHGWCTMTPKQVEEMFNKKVQS